MMEKTSNSVDGKRVEIIDILINCDYCSIRINRVHFQQKNGARIKLLLKPLLQPQIILQVNGDKLSMLWSTSSVKSGLTSRVVLIKQYP